MSIKTVVFEPGGYLMQVFHWSRPYNSRVGYKSQGVGDKNPQKKGGKIVGQLHLPDKTVHLQTGRGHYPDKT